MENINRHFVLPYVSSLTMWYVTRFSDVATQTYFIRPLSTVGLLTPVQADWLWYYLKLYRVSTGAYYRLGVPKIAAPSICQVAVLTDKDLKPSSSAHLSCDTLSRVWDTWVLKSAPSSPFEIRHYKCGIFSLVPFLAFQLVLLITFLYLVIYIGFLFMFVAIEIVFYFRVPWAVTGHIRFCFLFTRKWAANIISSQSSNGIASKKFLHIDSFYL